MYYDTMIGQEDGCRGNMAGRPPDVQALIEHLNVLLQCWDLSPREQEDPASPTSLY